MVVSDDTQKQDQPVASVVQPSPPGPSGHTDKFGITKIFDDGLGLSWYLSDDSNNDPRVRTPETDGNRPNMVSNGDGSFNISWGRYTWFKRHGLWRYYL
jgi:hypothetical protein